MELRAFCWRHYCSFSFYSMPLFLRGREIEGKGEKKREYWRKKRHGDSFHEALNSFILIEIEYIAMLI